MTEYLWPTFIDRFLVRLAEGWLLPWDTRIDTWNAGQCVVILWRQA